MVGGDPEAPRVEVTLRAGVKPFGATLATDFRDRHQNRGAMLPFRPCY
jgi:hypothetical protein